MSYTNQGLIEDFLGRDLEASEAAILSLMISTVEKYINDLTGGVFGEVPETSRFYDGGLKIIDIDPCIDISSIELVNRDGTTASTYSIGQQVNTRPINEDYSRWLEIRSGKFRVGDGNIKVTAKFTFSATVPDHIQYLATYLVAQLFSEGFKENLKSESIEGYSRTWGNLIEQSPVLSMAISQYTEENVTI